MADKLLIGGIVVVVLAVLAASGVYGYLRYRWDQIRKVSIPSLVTPLAGSPFNVLLIGSDSRQGDSASESAGFGSSNVVTGQRSDVIKILHVDPKSGTASILDIPRDTFVTMSGMPSSSPFGGQNRINVPFNYGPGPLVQTIEKTFGIPINHYVEIDFNGFMGAVNAVGGVNLDFPYPARDSYTGMNVTRTGCQHLSGAQALQVARSRHYQYLENGWWHYDGTSDFGRIQRQDAFLQALIKAAESHYNPLTLNAFVGSVVNDVTIDSTFSMGDLLSLATTYHAFSASHLKSLTLPTYGVGYYESYGDVLFVSQPQASQEIAQFLGQSSGTVTTPPPSPYGSSSSSYSTSQTQTGSGSPGSGSPGSGPASSTTSTSAPPPPPFDPTSC